MERFVLADAEMTSPTSQAESRLGSILRIADTKLSDRGKEFKER